MRSCFGVRFIGFVLGSGADGDSSCPVANVDDFDVVDGFRKKAGKSVAARTRGELFALGAEWIRVGFEFLHRVTSRALHRQSTSALKDMFSEVATWTEHHEWCACRSEK